MKKIAFGLKFIISGIFLLFTVVAAVSFSSQYDGSELKTRYLLSGTKSNVDDDDIFDYYVINNGRELAVSLKDEHKKNYTASDSIEIPAKGPTSELPVTGIWHNAFDRVKSNSITFESENNITVIDFEAFFCSGITSITIPYSIDEIGDGAFYSCTSLTEVIFINSNEVSDGKALTCFCEIEEEEQEQQGEPEQQGGEDPEQDPEEGPTIEKCDLEIIPSFCFFRCTSLADITLPGSIKEIQEDAFSGCTALSTKIYFQSIEVIRARAFQGCTALAEIYISKSMFEKPNGDGIEPHAFNNCASSLKIVFYGSASKIETWESNHEFWGRYDDYDNTKQLTHDDIESDQDSTSEWLYSVDSTTHEVMLTKYIGKLPDSNGGFISCPDTIDGNPVTRIDHDVFENDVKLILRRIYLPTTLKAIENRMFGVAYKKLCVIDSNLNCTKDEGKTDAQLDGRIDLSDLVDLEFIGTRSFCSNNKSKNNNTDNAESMGGDTIPNSGNKKYKQLITKLHLPAHLIAIGGEAFGGFNTRMFPYVTDFQWDYDENSRLECIGEEAFYGLGYNDGNTTGQINQNLNSWTAHKTTTIIFPKTFRYFGLLTADKNRYKDPTTARNNGYSWFDFNSTEYSQRGNRPSHAFMACSLIDKVIFKGSTTYKDPNCSDLIIPLQTFCFNESLHTIIFEERNGYSILFHTQSDNSVANSNHWSQESIGSNAGRSGNDFRGEPFLQTLILPNKYTTLLIQDFAFRGNSRAALYLTDTYGTNMYGFQSSSYQWPNSNNVNTSNNKKDFINKGSNNANLKNLESMGQWRTIGDESVYERTHSAAGDDKRGYYGYCFASTALGSGAVASKNDPSLNTYSIDQKMPVHENIYYSETVTKKSKAKSGRQIVGRDVNISVEVGGEVGNDPANTRILKFVDKCAYVCEEINSTKVATMTKYMYNLQDYTYGCDDPSVPKALKTAAEAQGASQEAKNAWNTWKTNYFSTARVKETITIDEDNYTVTAIGDSAFSACYCDGTDIDATNIDLKHIALPNTIKTIGEYAFIRTYALEDIKSYSGAANPTEGMPSGLEEIGKNAFLFSGIKAVLNIPDTCVFHENTSGAATGVCSVFSNAVRLRQITFDGNDSTQSTYYLTTTYSHTGGGTFTTAIYSKSALDLSDEDELFKKNGERLLLVLNRDYNDFDKTSTDVVSKSPSSGVYFNGQYKTNAHLYGAYKMGYWIEDLRYGSTTDNIEAQPLICAVGTRSNYTSTLTQKPMYLGVAEYVYDSLYSDLEAVGGDILGMPKYAFNGCEKLSTITLPYSTSGEDGVKDGLFKQVNAEFKAKNSSDQSLGGIIDGVNTLDLSGSNYAYIGVDSFRENTALQKFIAPDVDEFTIGEYAFADCDKLKVIDLRNVNNRLVISANAFNGVGITGNDAVTILWPESAEVIIEESAFSGCTKLQSLSLPVGLSSLGEKAFYGCTGLTSVTCADPMNNLDTISSEAFSGCTALNSFDFDNMTALTEIQSSAFYNAGTLGGGITIPKSVTTIGANAFEKSKITILNIDSDPITLGANAFDTCTSLTAVRFIDDDSVWTGYNSGVFNNCTALTELHLPSTYEANNSGGNIIGGDTSIRIYLYQPYTSSTITKDSWHVVNGIPKPLYFYVDSITTLNTAGELDDGQGNVKTGRFYWTYFGGETITLEHLSSYSDGIVRFDNQNYVLTADGFAKVVSLTYNSQSGEYVGSVSAHKGDALIFTTDGGTTFINPANMARKDGATNNLTKDGNQLLVVWGNSDNIYIRDLGGGNWDAWFNAPATPASYSILKNGAAAAATSVALEDNNKGQFTIDLGVNDVISVKYNEDILYFWETGTTSSYQALRPGTYTVCINQYDRVFLRLPAKSASNITATVNGSSIELTDIKEGGSSNVAEYSITLTKGQRIIFNEGYDTLVFPSSDNATSFVALETGVHTFYVNSEFKVYVNGPQLTGTQTLYVTNNRGWSSVNAHHWKDDGTSTSWPGDAMTLVGTNSTSEGIYSITIDLTEHDKIIFNGDGKQTVTIDLSNINQNAFWISDTTNGSGHYELGGNWTYVVPAA